VGVLLGTGRGGGFVVALSNVSRAVPTLALLTIFAVTPIGFGDRATTIALAVFAARRSSPTPSSASARSTRTCARRPGRWA
jgi:hypothetical protein